MSGFSVDDDGKSAIREKRREAYMDIPAGTRIVTGVMDREEIEMNPKNVGTIFEATVVNAMEYIRTQEKVTLVIPMMGGIPLADNLIRRLGWSGYDLSKIDLRFSKKYQKGVDENGKPINEYVFDNEEKMEGAIVMIDDIVDSGEAYHSAVKIIEEKNLGGRMICFTPFIKDGVQVSSTEYEIASTVRLKKLGHAVAPLSQIHMESLAGVPADKIHEAYADVNYVAMLENVWVDTGLGMNSGHMEGYIASAGSVEELKKLALIQSYERYAPVCLSGIPEDLVEYGEYLEKLVKDYFVYDSFAALRAIEEVHFVNGKEKGLAEARIKMAMARKYFEAILKTDFQEIEIFRDFAD